MTRQAREGFSLIEILVSVVIFSAVILSLAGLSLRIAKRSSRATDQALIIGALLAHQDRATTIAYDSLSRIATCDTSKTGNVSVISCTSVSKVTNRTSNVQIVVRTTIPGGHPDTIAFMRGKTRGSIPTK